jgi:hypothetical protein
MRFETVGPRSGQQHKPGLFGRLWRRFSKHDHNADASALPAGLKELSRRLQLNRSQQRGLAGLAAEFQQLVGQSNRRSAQRSADQVIRFDGFDLLPPAPSGHENIADAQRLYSTTLARFAGWLATLDSRQRAQFRQILQQRHGAF